jgi:hypothetical protein
LLVANSSLAVTGLTVLNGAVDVGADPRVGGEVPCTFGGGGVFVAWPETLVRASAVFVDVVFVNCTVTGVAYSGLSILPLFLGGGGLAVTGGGNGSMVQLHDCAFVNNSVTAVVGTGAPYASLSGGGVSVNLGVALGSIQTLLDAVIAVDGVLAAGNTLGSCQGIGDGKVSRPAARSSNPCWAGGWVCPLVNPRQCSTA